MGLVAVVTSGKGGAGKSTVTAGLGCALNARGKRVLLIDGDAGLRTLDILLGIGDQALYDIADIFSGSCEPAQAVYNSPYCEGLMVIPAPYSLERLCTPKEMMRLCKSFSPYYDVILIDCPAGIGAGFDTAVAAADRALVVTTPDLICARDAGNVAGILGSRQIPARLIVNRLRPLQIIRGRMPDVDEIIDTAGVRLIGLLPEDEEVTVATSGGGPVPSNCAFSECVNNIARRLYGESVPLATFNR